MFEVLVIINWYIIFLLEIFVDFDICNNLMDLFILKTRKVFIKTIIIENIDCDVIVILDMIFVKRDKPDGSMKGKHKLVGK